MVNYYPAVWEGMPAWVGSNKTTQNIQAVIGLGDNTNEPADSEMQEARKGWDVIDNTGLPYVVCIGNHDYDASLISSGQVGSRADMAFHKYFGPNRYSGKSWFGGADPDSTQNYYITFPIESQQFLILVLEFYPCTSVLAWAQGVLNDNPNAEVILATHAYLNPNGTRIDTNDSGGPRGYGLADSNSSGAELWDRFIKLNRNIKLVVCGHQTGGPTSAYSYGVDTAGLIVNQLFANHQFDANGGDGYMVLLNFHPPLDSVYVSIYSDFLKSYDPTGTYVMPWSSTKQTAAGMIFSGVDSTYEVATVQSLESFTPPFAVQVQGMATAAHNIPFGLAITSSNGGEGITIFPNWTACCTGVWDQFSQGAGTSWSDYGQNNIYSSPQLNVEYELGISVDASGNANLSIGSGGDTLGSTSKQIGVGPFYVLLYQREGLPDVVGANQAYWQGAKVTSGTNGQVFLQDDFTKDSSLNTSLWQVNGTVGQAVGPYLSNPPSTVVTPVISFPPPSMCTNIVRATALLNSTQIQLPAGCQLYVYGMDDGGLSSSLFAKGPSVYVKNAHGDTSAQICVDTVNSNSFTTQSSYPLIGGFGVSCFRHVQGYYATNPGPAAETLGLPFKLYSPALVAIIGAGSSQQYLTFSGLPNLTIDVDPDTIAFSIAHAYLGAGTYRVQENSFTTSADQDPNNQADLIGVLIFSEQPGAAYSPNDTIRIPITSVPGQNISMPGEMSLSQNYPNPFNPSTSIHYGLPVRSHVKLEIFNTLGQVVATLVSAEQEAGYHDVSWQPNASSGMYFYRLEATSTSDPSKSFSQVRKMILIK